MAALKSALKSGGGSKDCPPSRVSLGPTETDEFLGPPGPSSPSARNSPTARGASFLLKPSFSRTYPYHGSGGVEGLGSGTAPGYGTGPLDYLDMHLANSKDLVAEVPGGQGIGPGLVWRDGLPKADAAKDREAIKLTHAQKVRIEEKCLREYYAELAETGGEAPEAQEKGDGEASPKALAFGKSTTIRPSERGLKMSEVLRNRPTLACPSRRSRVNLWQRALEDPRTFHLGQCHNLPRTQSDSLLEKFEFAPRKVPDTRSPLYIVTKSTKGMCK